MISIGDPNDYINASKFVREIFKKQARQVFPDIFIYAHFTHATDIKQSKNVILSIMDTVVRQNLGTLGLMDNPGIVDTKAVEEAKKNTARRSPTSKRTELRDDIIICGNETAVQNHDKRVMVFARGSHSQGNLINNFAMTSGSNFIEKYPTQSTLIDTPQQSEGK